MSARAIAGTQPAQVVAVDGSCTLLREDIAGKAWGLNRMRALGLSVPPAIVATTHACREYHATGRGVPDQLWVQIVGHMRVLEQGSGRRFGVEQRPLLVSVRSGAQSMPGMMDTVLDLGINVAVEAALAETGDARLSPRPLVALFGATYRDRRPGVSVFRSTGLAGNCRDAGPSRDGSADRSFGWGLPIGVRIVGPYLEDRTTIAFAKLIAREFGASAPRTVCYRVIGIGASSGSFWPKAVATH